jgi:predicted permease
METLLRDLRYTLRRLRQTPGFTFLAVASLGIGLGAVTTIYSLVNAFLLRPLPLPEPGRLVYAYESSTDGSGFHSFSYLQYRDLARRTRSLSGLAAFDVAPLSVKTTGEAQIALGLVVSGNYFETLGARPALGRFFVSEEDATPGTHPVAVVSHAFWRRQLGGDSSAVGRVIQVNSRAFTIVGVAPASFTGVSALLQPALWTPIMMAGVTRPGLALQDRTYSTFQLVGRLDPRADLRAAERELTALTKQIVAENPSKPAAGVQLFPFTSMPTEAMKGIALFLSLLMAFAVLILLVACANLASMLLARSIQRRREVAIRMALGAARIRLVRQLLVETVLLFLASTTVASVIAVSATRAVAAFKPPIEIPIELDVGVDMRVLAFSAALALIVGVLFGLVPALRATRTPVAAVLKDEAASVSSRSRWRGALVVGQVAFTCLLLVSAGLVVRALRKASAIDPGFDPRNVHVVGTNLQMGSYDALAGHRLIAAWRDGAAGLAGVRGVAMTRRAPLGLGNSTVAFTFTGTPGKADPWRQADYTAVSPEYFNVMGIPVLRGRGVGREDSETSSPVAVVSAALARRYLDGVDRAVGRSLWIGTRPENRVTVVGVVADTKVRSLVEDPLPMLYQSIYQIDPAEVSLLARTAPGAGGIGRALGAELRRLDPNLPLMASSSLEEHVGLALLPQRFAAIVSATLGLAALVLAIIGVYGIVAYAVARRTREIGIRVAIGATPRSVVALVAREGLQLAAIGLGVGVVLALAATRAMSAFLLGVSPADAITFLVIAAPLAAIAVAASYLPARRAAKVDPLVAMRQE